MRIRYSDQEALKNSAQDFVTRRREPSPVKLLILFLLTFAIGLTIVVTFTNKYSIIALIVILTAIIGWYVTVQIQRNYDLLLTTEFQNALFASALGLNTKFCMIMKRDGNIFYLDRSFQSMFPDFLKQSRRSLDVLLELGRVSGEDTERIYAAINQGVYEKVVFNIKGAGSEIHKIVMSVEPILRPRGFVLLRGREFVETRSNNETVVADAPLLSKPTITLFAHVMDTMNMGIYMTGPTGKFIYANPLFERWLGFDEGEITSTNLALSDVIQHNRETSEGIVPDDFEGELMLRKKNSGLMKAFVNQKIIRDESNKLLGCTAIVHSFNDNKQEVKKKLW